MIRRLFLLSFLALASAADAQNTESLRGAEHAIATQIAVGGMSALFRSYGRQLGSMLAANLSVQGWTEDAVTIRGDLWALRSSQRSDYYVYAGPDTPPRLDGHHSTESFAIAVGLGPVFRVNLPRDGSIEASVGAGIVPWHFVVQQHAVQLFNADPAVFSGENAPLTFGFRW
ncbi:MAG TPA: hypothetical protein VIP11_02880 [Gemmatimonadaceae bacterium]